MFEEGIRRGPGKLYGECLSGWVPSENNTNFALTVVKMEEATILMLSPIER